MENNILKKKRQKGNCHIILVSALEVRDTKIGADMTNAMVFFSRDQYVWFWYGCARTIVKMCIRIGIWYFIIQYSIATFWDYHGSWYCLCYKRMLPRLQYFEITNVWDLLIMEAYEPMVFAVSTNNQISSTLYEHRFWPLSTVIKSAGLSDKCIHDKPVQIHNSLGSLLQGPFTRFIILLLVLFSYLQFIIISSNSNYLKQKYVIIF